MHSYIVYTSYSIKISLLFLIPCPSASLASQLNIIWGLFVYRTSTHARILKNLWILYIYISLFAENIFAIQAILLQLKKSELKSPDCLVGVDCCIYETSRPISEAIQVASEQAFSVVVLRPLLSSEKRLSLLAQSHTYIAKPKLWLEEGTIFDF